MRKIILVSTVAAMSLFATNGDSLIGLGAQSRGMGGVGIATYFGAENALTNPALIAKSKGFEFDFGATYFSPDVKVNNHTSKADTNMIPEISLSQKINDRLSFGLGMFGSAGMGVDFRDENELFNSRTNLLLMKIAPSIGYKVNDKLSVGFAPVLQYGALDISFDSNSSAAPGGEFGPGVSDDFGLGFQIGLTYDFTPDTTIGLEYKSAIDMVYDRQINTTNGAGSRFKPYLTKTLSDHLEQPEEYGIGISHDYENYTFAIDYKRINWSKAKGYKDFGWDDQDVVALGAKYTSCGSWYAIGYNYAKNPIKNLPATSPNNMVLNTLNYVMFPATEETHYTFGYGRKLSEHLTFGFNIVYAPKTTVNTKGMTATAMPPANIKTEHSETSSTVSFKYNF